MYGEGRNLRYFIGLGLVIVLLFIAIFMIMRSGNGSKVPETKRELTSYVDDANFTVTETIVGPITAAETHTEMQISVTNSQATIEISKGYDGNVITSRSYPLSDNGFSEFLSALNRAGFTRGDTKEDLKDDKGFCPSGYRYIFEARDGSNTVQRFWQTTCGGTKTYKGQFNQTRQLFRAQIPDYDTLTADQEL